MQRRMLSVVLAVAGALLIAVAAAAHGANGGKLFGTFAGSGIHSSVASAERSPEPKESPEASPRPEPTEKPEPSRQPEPTEKPDALDTEDSGDKSAGGSDSEGGSGDNQVGD